MKTKILMSCIALCMFFQTVQAFEVIGGSEADAVAFNKIYDTWVDGYVNGNLDGIVNILSEDVVIMAENQPTVKGKAAAREFFAPRVGRPGVSFTDDIQEVRINGDWGFVNGNFVIEIASKEAGKAPYVHSGRYFVLYRKENGKWLVFRDIDNKMPMLK